MNQELRSQLERATELIADLEKEYKSSLEAHTVTERSRNLTHEVLEKLRHVIDHAFRMVWEKRIGPRLTEKQRQSARVYFPIAENLSGFRSLLGRAHMADLEQVDRPLYDFLLGKQSFTSSDNQWLATLAAIAATGKHIRLLPQKRVDTKRITVKGPGGGSVSWDPSSVTFGQGVSIMGAPVDPQTQRVAPTPGITESVEVWVSFVIEDHDVNALGFCKEAAQKIAVLVEEIYRFA